MQRERFGQATAETLLRELGLAARITVYIAAAPGVGKTRRLIEDALARRRDGLDVAIGWLETKGRPDLETLAAPLPRIPPRRVEAGGSVFNDFDFAATVAAKPQFVVLDELAHDNLPGGAHQKRWQDALALRDAGISVAGALNVQHIDTVAGTAERYIGFPVREIVPMSFLRAADQVVALDVAPEQLEERLAAGKIFGPGDVAAARSGIFRPQTLAYLREMMLRTVDALNVPQVVPQKTSTLLALASGDGEIETFMRKCAALAAAQDFGFDVALVGERNLDAVVEAAQALSAQIVPLQEFDLNKPSLGDLKAALIAVPAGPLAKRIAGMPLQRDVFVCNCAPAREAPDRELSFSRYAQTAGDRMRIGYGRLITYLGSAAGSGKTYAMLERAHALAGEGKDVVAAFVETHGRRRTDEKLAGLEAIPPRWAEFEGVRSKELDLARLLERRPQIALIDELAHTNASCDEHGKRYDDVMQVLRAGISVMTTLNVQHLEGLNDTVYRLTGQRVRETVPDEILSLADEVVLVDTTPETLRERLRAGDIYPPERIESALANFFSTENLAALRDIALREMLHARGKNKPSARFGRLALGVSARERDAGLIERCARIASRLEVDLSVIHVPSGDSASARSVQVLAEVARRVRARWVVASPGEPAAVLVATAAKEGAGTIVVEGARKMPHWTRWPRGTPFGRRLLDAGASQILILEPG